MCKESQPGGRDEFYTISKEKRLLNITRCFFFIRQVLHAYSMRKAFVVGCGYYLDARLANICQFC